MAMTIAFKRKLFGVYDRLNGHDLVIFMHQECANPVPMLEGRLVRTFLNTPDTWVIAHYAWLRLGEDPWIPTERAVKIVVDRVLARGELIA